MLIKFAGLAVINSRCLKTLVLGMTYSSAEDGKLLMQALADSHVNTLQELEILSERAWFEGRDQTVSSLLVFLARQSNLQKLSMEGNGLSAA